MFEQYGYEELRHLALSTDDENMYAEYCCRRAAEKYKDMSDKELEDSMHRLYAHFGPPSRQHKLMSIELFRRDAKAKGITELPVEIKIPEPSPEGIAYRKELAKFVSLQKQIDKEKNSPDPDIEKIKKLEEELEVCNKKRHDLCIILDERGE